MQEVGTPRFGIIARVIAGGIEHANELNNGTAERGADGRKRAVPTPV
jgi:hypothetical protein